MEKVRAREKGWCESLAKLACLGQNGGPRVTGDGGLRHDFRSGGSWRSFRNMSVLRWVLKVLSHNVGNGHEVALGRAGEEVGAERMSLSLDQ